MNILIVEDDKSQLQMYNDVIESFSKQHGIKIESTCFETIDKGMEAIKKPFYDAAIIDLKLSANTTELEGMSLVNAINGKLRIPIYIVSGSIAQVDIKENSLFQKRLRTDNFKDILTEIKAVYDTGITKFLNHGGQIDEMLSSIFWNHLSTDLNIWIKHNNPDTLLRYILAHFQEYLDINPTGDFQEYHPSEVYIKPPIKKNFHTGDLIKLNNNLFLILTPACDIVYNYKTDGSGNKTQYRKADNVTLAEVIDFDYKSLCLSKDGKVDKNKVSEYVRNNNGRFHYLPPYLNSNGYIIDFQKLSSVSFKEQFTTIASISYPFIKDIISRFSSYYSRQGQPTFNQDQIINEFMKNSQSVTTVL